MNEFAVYLTSLGSQKFYPDNDNGSFTNLLSQPLINMRQYRVTLAACCLSDKIPMDTILVCSDIVAPTFFNDKQLPILGVCSGQTGHVVPIFSPLQNDSISMINCSLLDVNGNKITLNSVPLIVLKFVRE